MELMMYELLKVTSETHRIHSLRLHTIQDFNPMGVREAYQRLAKYSGILCASVFILTIMAAFFVSDVSSEWAIRELTLFYLLGYLAYEGMVACSFEFLWVFMHDNSRIRGIYTHVLYRLRPSQVKLYSLAVCMGLEGHARVSHTHRRVGRFATV